MAHITVNQPYVSIKDGRAKITSRVTFPEGDKELWFECDEAYAHGLTPETCDGFVVALLPLAISKGFDVHVAGPMSSRLNYNLNMDFPELAAITVPGAKKVKVIPSTLITTNWGGKGVLTGFSAGVDSFCTVIEHTNETVPAPHRLTHLALNNVGSHGQNENDLSTFRIRFTRLQKASETLGLPLFAIDSNLDEVLGIDFQKSHALRNIGVSLLFQKMIGKYLYASSFHYSDLKFKTYELAVAEPVILPMLSTETLEGIASGTRHTRFNKTAIVANYPASATALDVCVEPARAAQGRPNCSRCVKCLRTMLTLEMHGKLDNYAPVFELGTYARLRTLQIAYILRHKNILSREIATEIRQRKYPIPLASRLLALLLPNKLIGLFLREYAMSSTGNPADILVNCFKAARVKLLKFKAA